MGNLIVVRGMLVVLALGVVVCIADTMSSIFETLKVVVGD